MNPAGLPQVLVDLRHEATHNELPSLPLLRLAACQALVWLRACYWQPQSDQLLASEARYRHLLQVPGCRWACHMAVIIYDHPRARQSTV